MLCVVLGCSKRSGRDKDVSFYRIPKVINNKGYRILELTKKRRAGYLAAISRGDVTEKILSNDRICSRHFVSGKPADLEDETNPDWLPSLNLGHSKVSDKQVKVAEDRWARKKAREDARATTDAVQGLLALCGPNEEDSDEDASTQTKDATTQTDLSSAMVNSVVSILEVVHLIFSSLFYR